MGLLERTGRSGKLIVTLALIPLTGLAFALFLATSKSDPRPYCQSSEVRKTECERRFEEADLRAKESISRRSRALADDVRSHKSGAKEFSESVVSWNGKWQVIKTWLPFMQKDGHQKYVEEQFAKYVLRPGDLESAATREINLAAQDFEAIQNQLATDISTELESGANTASGSRNSTQGKPNAITDGQKAGRKSVRDLAASEVLASVTEIVLSRVARQVVTVAAFDVSAVANAWWSMGMSLIIGFGIDAILSRVSNPAKEVEDLTIKSLDVLATNAETAAKTKLESVYKTKRSAWHSIAFGESP